eukprot:gene2929-biopygen11752
MDIPRDDCGDNPADPADDVQDSALYPLDKRKLQFAKDSGFVNTFQYDNVVLALLLCPV